MRLRADGPPFKVAEGSRISTRDPRNPITPATRENLDTSAGAQESAALHTVTLQALRHSQWIQPAYTGLSLPGPHAPPGSSTGCPSPVATGQQMRLLQPGRVLKSPGFILGPRSARELSGWGNLKGPWGQRRTGNTARTAAKKGHVRPNCGWSRPRPHAPGAH